MKLIKSSLTILAHVFPAVQAAEPMTAKDEGVPQIKLPLDLGARFLHFILS
ncbi:hypothetical protein [Sulfitobacter sp. DSM 110093]|uniref:hypothetical protein n=1 Tax=Sulfitobacter sp. DSM 110093 TaxID=2883127 RepID=UPI001FAB440C|nr:hypothetical protein [Sulfitobacter sp. DSM 110093]